jgi:hypothetical protein
MPNVNHFFIRRNHEISQIFTRFFIRKPGITGEFFSWILGLLVIFISVLSVSLWHTYFSASRADFNLVILS